MVPKFLTTSYPVEKHLFLIPRFALRLIGFYPETHPHWAVQLWAFFNFFVLVYGCYAELYYGIYYLWIDIPTALDAICPVASSIMSLVKMCCIWWYRAEIKFLIKRVRYLTSVQKSKAKIRVQSRYFTITTRLTALVLFFGFCTSTSYSVRTILTNTVRFLNGKPILYETPFKMMFPEVLLRMPYYPMTFLFSHWHGYITVVSFVGGDGFFLAFCFYFATLIKAIGFDLTDAVQDLQTEGKVKQHSEDQICFKLSNIIERHNEVFELMKKFSDVMVVITLGHFVTSSMIIGTSVVDLLLFSGYGVVVYVVYTCAVLTEIFLYCLGGTCVMENSTELATIAYCSEWYAHGIRVQKMILLIIMRAQRTLTVKVPFFAPSLEALTSILRFTGSLIALAKSVL